MNDRRGLVFGALAILFLGGMVALYLWATRSPDLPQVRPAPLPVAAARAPAKAPRTAPPPRATLPTALRPTAPDEPEDDEDTDEVEDPLAPVDISILVTDDRQEPLRLVPVTITSGGTQRGKRFTTDRDGRVTARVKAGVHVLVAERADGMLRTLSEPTTIEADAGSSWDVTLVVPSEETAGVGVSFYPSPEGKKIGRVHPGSPAEAAGLLAGDVITAVEGEPTDAMDNSEFVAAMTGPVGTKVLFDVLRPDGTEERVQVERDFIEE